MGVFEKEPEAAFVGSDVLCAGSAAEFWHTRDEYKNGDSIVVLDVGDSVLDENKESRELGLLDERELRFKSNLSTRVSFEQNWIEGNRVVVLARFCFEFKLYVGVLGNGGRVRYGCVLDEGE